MTTGNICFLHCETVKGMLRWKQYLWFSIWNWRKWIIVVYLQSISLGCLLLVSICSKYFVYLFSILGIKACWTSLIIVVLASENRDKDISFDLPPLRERCHTIDITRATVHTNFLHVLRLPYSINFDWSLVVVTVKSQEQDLLPSLITQEYRAVHHFLLLTNFRFRAQIRHALLFVALSLTGWKI